MIPIIYESNETAFTSNGLGRLRSCISCQVTEERNGIFECNFDYPIDGENYEDILLGRVIGVTHDDTGEIQPFDIVSSTKPINGIVSFHAVHISYRLAGYSVTGSNINSLSAALNMLTSSEPAMPFTFETDFSASGYMAAADGLPKTARQLLGGVEGSILDTYGGEFLWDRFRVLLKKNRGEVRDFNIRYGLNMTDYEDETDYSGVYNQCKPFWTDGQNTIIGGVVPSGFSGYAGRDICAPLDLSDKFETQPTQTALEEAALQYMLSNQTYLPRQNIKVDFIRLQDDPEYEQFENLLECRLCDSIGVIFPRYNMSGVFKIVKTVYDVLKDRFDSMELGALRVTLAEALGIGQGSGGSNTGGGSPGLLDLFYPVGSYYETSDADFNPNTAWGGTWELETSGQVHVSAGTGYAIGSTGGSATVTLTAAQSGVPAHGHGFTQPTVSGGAHQHSVYYYSDNSTGGSARRIGNTAAYSGTAVSTPSGGTHTHTVSGGAVSQNTAANASQAHNNMQPYIVVNRWHRTA